MWWSGSRPLTVVRENMWGFLLFASVAWLAIAWSVLRLEPADIARVIGPVLLFGALTEAVRALAGTRMWWLNAGMAVLFAATGVLVLADQSGSYAAPASLVGWYLMVRGAVDIAVSMMTRETDRIWGLLTVVGVLETGLGFFATGPLSRSGELVVVTLGGLALARGVSDLVAALRLREVGAVPVSILDLPPERAAGVKGYSAGLADYGAAPAAAGPRHRATARRLPDDGDGPGAVADALTPVSAGEPTPGSGVPATSMPAGSLPAVSPPIGSSVLAGSSTPAGSAAFGDAVPAASGPSGAAGIGATSARVRPAGIPMTGPTLPGAMAVRPVPAGSGSAGLGPAGVTVSGPRSGGTTPAGSLVAGSTAGGPSLAGLRSVNPAPGTSASAATGQPGAASPAAEAARPSGGSFHDEVLRTTADLDAMLALAGVTGAAMGSVLMPHSAAQVPDTPEGLELARAAAYAAVRAAQAADAAAVGGSGRRVG
jgi:uncharacterized membrane protein HdeD (DUF308 family)